MGYHRVFFHAPFVLVCLALVVSAAPPMPEQSQPRLSTPKQEHVAIAETRLSLVPPSGFKPSKQFLGFEEESTSSSIVVGEISGPFSEATAGFRREILEPRGLTLLSKEPVTIGEQTGLLMHLEKTSGDRGIVKWIVALGDQSETAIITATFPKELEKELSTALRDSVLTVKWDRAKKLDQLAGLNFSIQSSPPLQFADRRGELVTYAVGGKTPGASFRDPVFMAGRVHPRGEVGDRKKYSELQITQVPQHQNLRIETSEAITIDGLDGYEIIATAKHRDTGVPILSYQVMLFDGRTIYMMAGVFASEMRHQYLDSFKQMARSFKRK